MKYIKLFEQFTDNILKLFNYLTVNNKNKRPDVHTLNVNSPTWCFFKDPELLQEQWMVHFSWNSSEIVKYGFTKGMPNIENLGLTVYLDEKQKNGGYNFAFTISDLKKAKWEYSEYNEDDLEGYKYDGDIVIFKSTGVRAYHLKDEEYQTIFYGKSAKNINEIIFEKNNWILRNKNDELMFENVDLEIVIDWFVKNYNQTNFY